MKSGTNELLDVLYVIIDTRTDLPVYVADTFRETVAWLGCSFGTLNGMLRRGLSFNGYIVEIVDDT